MSEEQEKAWTVYDSVAEVLRAIRTKTCAFCHGVVVAPVVNVASRIRGFSEKNRLNARGFAREFPRSGMLYRPGKSLKRRGKSSSLHSKKNFLLGGAGFLWVTS